MRYAAIALAVPLVILCGVLGYYYVSFARIIDARLHGERDTVFPRVLARPLEIRRGQSLTDRQLIDRLNDLGYAQRASIEKPGEFAIGRGAVTIKLPIAGGSPGQSLVLVADSQGCADVGVCYPPTRQRVRLTVPQAGAGSGPSVAASPPRKGLFD